MSRIIVISAGVPGTTPERVAHARAAAPGFEILLGPEEEELERRAADVEVAFDRLPAALVPRATGLRWVQLGGAGAERDLERYASPLILLTNASGVHGIPITEHVLSYLFALARGIPRSVRAQGRHEWLRHDSHTLFELQGKRLLVVGVGAIGGELARAASALGMRVTGVRRRPSPDGTEGVEEIVDPEGLPVALPGADFVVLPVPHTPATHLMFGEREFALMKSGAFFVNIGRGKTADQAALIRALLEGRIAGAGLDVFEQEPLPADSPLWDMENVIITAHYAGLTPQYGERLWAIFMDNLDRYVRGLPLRNVVDRQSGY